MYCYQCGRSLAEHNHYCPYCGVPMPPVCRKKRIDAGEAGLTYVKKNRAKAWVLCILVIVFVVMGTLISLVGLLHTAPSYEDVDERDGPIAVLPEGDGSGEAVLNACGVSLPAV